MSGQKNGRPKSSPKTSQPDNTIAYELVGLVNEAISQAVFITTTTEEQTTAIANYCERLHTLFANVDSHTDQSFSEEYNGIIATALMIWEACESGQVKIAYRQELKP